MNKKIKPLLSHVEAGDYFGTLATLLNLLEQGIVGREEEGRILKDLVNDLVYLQENFRIVERKK